MNSGLAEARDGQGIPAQTPRVSTIYVRALLEAVNSVGLSVDAFLRWGGISAGQLANPYGWLDVRELDRLTEYAVERADDPAFGLHWGERSPLLKFDLFSMIAAHAPTLRECLACVLRFQPILVSRPELQVVERGSSVILRFEPLAATEQSWRVRTEFGISSLVRLMRHVGANSVDDVRRVDFRHRAPPYAGEYTRIFGKPARFAQAHSEIEVDRQWLDRAVSNNNLELHTLSKLQAEQVLVRVRNGAGYAGQLRDYLRSKLPSLPEMRDAARALALSERSLRRRLAEEGLSYSAIVQESQRLLAQQLLTDPTRSLQEVAFEVGFASLTAFHRAFKRWTGDSPATFRGAAAQRAEQAQDGNLLNARLSGYGQSPGGARPAGRSR